MRIEVHGYTCNNCSRNLHVLGPEKYPAEAHKMKSEKDACNFKECSFRYAEKFLYEFIYCQGCAVHSTPQNKPESSTMPQTAKQHGNKLIDISAHPAFAIAAQRNV